MTTSLKNYLFLIFFILLNGSTSTLLNAQCNQQPYPLRTNESYTLTAQSGLTNIQWYIDKGFGRQLITAPSGTSANLVVDTEGAYFYTAQDANGCKVDLCCPIQIKMCDETTYTLRTGESYTLTAQSGLTNIQWYVDKGFGRQLIATPSGTSTNLVVDTEGAYFYTAQDANGCRVDLCCPIRFQKCPDRTYSLGLGESYTLTTQSGLTNIQWYIDKGNVKTPIPAPEGNASTLVTTTDGWFSYTALDANGCLAETCCPTHIQSCNTVQYTLCPSESYTLTAQSGLKNVQWFVNNGNGKQLFGVGTAVRVNSGGTYSYTALDANDCPIELCCPFNIVAQPTITITSQPQSFKECIGGTNALFGRVTTSTDSSNLRYQWQISSDSLSWANIPNANSASFTPLSNQAIIRYYRLLVSLNNSVCPALTSQAVKVEVLDKPIISIINTNTAVCVGGGSLLNTTFIDRTQSCTIQWQQSVNNGGTWTNIAGATNTSLQVNNLSQSMRYRATLACALSGCCN